MKYLEKAIKIAASGSPDRNHYIGAIAIRTDGAIVCSSNSLTKVPQPAAHAESKVIKKCDYGSTLYVAKVTRLGDIGCAKPCKNCQTIIRNRGIKKVIYTISGNEYGVWFPQKEKLK